jgi:3',5'-cyclic AMP phosphodiesterase CpdA
VSRRNRRQILLVVVLVGAAGGCSVPPPARYTTRPGAADHFSILGDTRQRHPLRFWVRTHNRERRLLARAVAAERPAFVIMSGDFVVSGASVRRWAWFDRVYAPLRAAGIAVLPALGNHELLGGRRQGLRHYFARFPGLARQRWYRRDWKGVVLLTLDSNRSHMSRALWRQQRAWFAAQLRGADRDPKVRAVVVTVHHPPFTNSTDHGDDRDVRRELLPAFMNARKTVALVAGHVHTYERFVRRGKTFLNSGGGGAPRCAVLVGARRRHTDDRFRGPAWRPFHYVTVRLTPQGLAGTVRGMQPGAARMHTLERFLWAWPGGAPP